MAKFRQAIGIAAWIVSLCVAVTALARADPPLIDAAKRGDLPEIMRLLQAGVPVDDVDEARNTALIFAARDGRYHIAAALIGAGAAVDWIDGEGVTPLILAAFKGHVEIVRLLLVHGADAAIRDRWNRTALDYAFRRGAGDEIARLLRDAARRR